MREMLRGSSYLKKSLILYFTAAGILVCGFTGIYLHLQAERVKTSVDNTVGQFLNRTAAQFEKVLDEMSRISYGIATDEETFAVLSSIPENPIRDGENYFMYSVSDRRTLQLKMLRLNGDDFDKRSIYIISDQNDYVNLDIYKSENVGEETLRTLPWRAVMEETGKSRYLMPPGPDGYGRAEGEVFSFVRRIQNEFGGCGYVDVQLKKECLSEIFEIQMEEYRIHAAVLMEGELFYATDEVTADAAAGIRELSLAGNGSGGEPGRKEMKVGKEEYIVYSHSIPQYGMYVSLFVSGRDYRGMLYRNLSAAALLGFCLLTAVFGVVWLITKSLNRPIRQLKDQIARIDYEELKPDLNIEQTNDEVVMLAEVFQNMLGEIKRKNAMLIETKTGELKARYQVLQAQINPHFLYNILSVMGLMGYQKGAPEIMDMCGMLTKMLRYSTGTPDGAADWEQEFEQAGHYLGLMKYRYLDKLVYRIEMDEELKRVPIPRFVLQPIAENCFRHGFAGPRREQYRIEITGICTEEGYRVSVRDNGSGFTKEALNTLNRKFDMIRNELTVGNGRIDLEIGGMGLANTYARVLLFAGGEIAIHISNRDDGMGSLVELTGGRKQ